MRKKTVKHKKTYIGVVVVATVILLILIGTRQLFNDYFSSVKLQYIESYLGGNYLYEIDEEAGMKNIYAGFLGGVQNDVTYYLKKDDFRATQIQDKGHYFGTGMMMMWHMNGQSFVITEVIEDSPADQAGIEAGDEIIQVNEIPVRMANSHVLTQKMFSHGKEPVTFSLVGEKGKREVTLMPEEVMLHDIESRTIDDKLYIRLRTIQSETADRIKTFIVAAEQIGCKGVILDLRDVYSHNIEEVAEICDIFLNQDTAFKIKGKADQMTVYQMTEQATTMKLCLITNTGTKGATEAIALGLQERAKRVGSDTAGLKYTRSLIALEDGSGMSVASGIIVDQYGNELPKEGLAPDVRVYIGKEEKLQLLEKGRVNFEDDSFIKAALSALDDL